MLSPEVLKDVVAIADPANAAPRFVISCHPLEPPTFCQMKKALICYTSKSNFQEELTIISIFLDSIVRQLGIDS
jgi:hypothetical protein